MAKVELMCAGSAWLALGVTFGGLLPGPEDHEGRGSMCVKYARPISEAGLGEGHPSPDVNRAAFAAQGSGVGHYGTQEVRLELQGRVARTRRQHGGQGARP